jgi:hypothetical protein
MNRPSPSCSKGSYRVGSAIEPVAWWRSSDPETLAGSRTDLQASSIGEGGGSQLRSA